MFMEGSNVGKVDMLEDMEGGYYITFLVVGSGDSLHVYGSVQMSKTENILVESLFRDFFI
jgi:hypothetical protein